jgi:2-polyprenyl-6-methoxyphenol hydroxylase-like FAD-dependent oxidoreductase
VIGADGLHSAVRRIAFGPDEQFEKYLGYGVAAFEAEGYRPRDELVYVGYTQPGRQVACFSLRNDYTFFLFVFRDGSRGVDVGDGDRDAKALLHGIFEGAGWECPQILSAMDACDTLYFDRMSQIRMSRWTEGRLALVGDAACCVSLLAGEGAGLAMAGACVLAGELYRSCGDHVAAFARYKRRLRHFVLAKQNSAERFASWLAPRTRAGLLLRNVTSRLMSFEPLAELVIGRSLRDDFVLPDYPASPRAGCA